MRVTSGCRSGGLSIGWACPTRPDRQECCLQTMGEDGMTRLTGKIAWVTGAGTGIGEAAALALAEEGATVILTGRRPAPLENVAHRINQSGQAHVQPADLTDSAQVQKVGDYIRDTF